MSVMSELDFDRQIIENVRRALEGPDITPEEEIEYRADFLVRELDDFCAMANDPAKVHLIEGQRIAVGQMMARIQIIAGFLLAHKEPKLTLVRNPG